MKMSHKEDYRRRESKQNKHHMSKCLPPKNE